MIKIGNREIGRQHLPLVIAEMSGNHNQSLERALEIVEAAAKTGAQALKIQTYTPDTITLNCDSEDFKIRGGLWDGRTLYELFEEAHMPWDWRHTELGPQWCRACSKDSVSLELCSTRPVAG